MNHFRLIPPRCKALVITCCVLGIFLFQTNAANNAMLSIQTAQVPTIPEADPLCVPLHTAEEHRTNLLLIGQDRREGESRARSDCMILCTLQPDSGRIIMTSFLRDLYVEIPGHGHNRLNAAYAFGGAELLHRTLSHNFGVSIDGCVEADFSQFPKLIDMAGGVQITLRQDEADHINTQTSVSSLQAGTQWLNGEQALIYSRIRSLDNDGDFSRTSRQRAILSAILQRFQNASVPELMALFRSCSNILSTDMPKKELLSLALRISPALSHMEVTSQQIPIADSYNYQMKDNMSVLVADMNANREFLHQQLLIK